jgi:hypothetical protein
MCDLPNAPESRREPQIPAIKNLEMAHQLVPGLESLPEIIGSTGRIAVWKTGSMPLLSSPVI